MLRLVHIEEIVGSLLMLPDLLREHERNTTTFTSKAEQWLANLESMLAANRQPQAGMIALLRSGLVAARRGHVPPGVEIRGRPNRSRVSSAVALQAIQRAAEIASGLLAPSQTVADEGERLARQIVAVAASRNLIPSVDETASNTEFLRAVRRRIATHNDLENLAVHLEGLMGIYDALALIDRALGVLAQEDPRAPI